MTEREYRGPKKVLKFIPGEYEDAVFVVAHNRALRALVWLLAPILRAGLFLRRLIRRLFSRSTEPPDVR
jgi:hypothetical protein